MTGESMIDYEALAQEAMRNVVRSVLAETAAKGLPGDHHFYISFDTLAPGVILSKRLREKYQVVLPDFEGRPVAREAAR